MEHFRLYGLFLDVMMVMGKGWLKKQQVLVPVS